MGRAVGADSGKRQEPRRDLLVREVVLEAEFLDLKRPGSDAGRKGMEIRASVPRSDSLPVEALRDGRHRFRCREGAGTTCRPLTEIVYERVDRANRCRPR